MNCYFTSDLKHDVHILVCLFLFFCCSLNWWNEAELVAQVNRALILLSLFQYCDYISSVSCFLFKSLRCSVIHLMVTEQKKIHTHTHTHSSIGLSFFFIYIKKGTESIKSKWTSGYWVCQAMQHLCSMKVWRKETCRKIQRERRGGDRILPVSLELDLSARHTWRLTVRFTDYKGFKFNLKGRCGVCLSDPGW